MVAVSKVGYLDAKMASFGDGDRTPLSSAKVLKCLGARRCEDGGWTACHAQIEVDSASGSLDELLEELHAGRHQ